jgi:hypothetical protein
MQTNRPTLARALLKGSLQHFLTAFAIPLLVIGGAISLRLGMTVGGVSGEGILFVLTLVSLVLGTIFLFHEVVLLVAAAVERRRRRSSPPETDLANDFLMTVVSADLVALLLLFGVLVWQGVEIREVLVYFLLPVLGFYGVHLFGCCVREAFPPRPVPPDSLTAGEAPQRASAALPGRVMPGLQVYATGATALLAWGAVGWPQDWLATFGIGLVSILVGRGVERMASRWRQRQGGNNTGP